MKKIISFGLGISILSGSVFASNLTDLDPKFYAGAELKGAKSQFGTKFSNAVASYNRYGNLLPSKRNVGLGFLAGVQLNPYVALELGYTTFKTKKSSIRIGDERLGLKYKPKNLYLDVLGFLPIDSQYKLIGSFGFGRLKNGIHVDDIESTVMPANGDLKNALGNNTKTRMRFGIGAQFDLDKNWGFRAMLRHQRGNDFVKRVNSFGVGTVFTFV